MSINTDRARHIAETAAFLTPGRYAGRLIDGADLIIDGEPGGRMPPRWVDDLKRVGWQTGLDLPVAFSVAVDGKVRERRPELREALYEALALISGGYAPSRVRVTADTPSGLSVEVVSDFRIIGMAIGALEDDPITVIEGPSWLPPYPPGEEPRRKRWRVRRRRP